MVYSTYYEYEPRVHTSYISYRYVSFLRFLSFLCSFCGYVNEWWALK